MVWLFEPMPETLMLLLGGSLAAAVLALAITRLRGTRLAVLAGANLAILLLCTLSLDRFGLPSQDLQVLIGRLMELPLVFGVAVLCVAQAGRLTPSERRLRRILEAAPALLACAWIVALVGEQAWPRPSLDPFAQMPVRNWALLTPLCVPFQFYLWCLAFLFARTAGPRAPTRRLRAQNLLLALAIGGYGLSGVNVLVGYAVLAFLNDPTRTRVTLVQFAIEDRLFMLWAPALLAGLLLAAFPAAARAARPTDLLTVLPMRERFEGMAWRLEAAGALRRLTRPLHQLGTAARVLGLSEADVAKALQAVKLAAVVGSPKAPPTLSRKGASKLLSSLEGAGLSQVHPPASWPDSAAGPRGALDPAHLPEVLDAALRLCAPTVEPPSTGRPLWYDLARAACIDAGIARAAATGGPDQGRAFKAYQEAADLARGA